MQSMPYGRGEKAGSGRAQAEGRVSGHPAVFYCALCCSMVTRSCVRVCGTTGSLHPWKFLCREHCDVASCWQRALSDACASRSYRE